MELLVSDVIIVGIASDYCVYNTVLDSIREGYEVHLIESCMRGVGEESTKKAMKEVKEKGAHVYLEIDTLISRNFNI